MENFGQHLCLDIANVKNKKLLKDFDTVYKFLDEMPARIKMRKVDDPHLKWIPNDTPKDKGGLSGFVILAESHVSIHTFPDKKFIFMDIFSCKSFKRGMVLDYITEICENNRGDIEWQMLDRGINFPM